MIPAVSGSENLPYFRTYTGLKFVYANPQPEQVCIEDIAHSLAFLCRFSGHSRKFYSVAEHSVRVMWLCEPQFKRWALLHDASEAYCADLPHPLKYSPGVEAYRSYEHLAQGAIAQRFGLDVSTEPKEVKHADRRLLVTEQRDLMREAKPDQTIDPLPFKIHPWSSTTSYKIFMREFNRLFPEHVQKKC